MASTGWKGFENAKFYYQFDRFNAPVWLVLVSIIPTIFEADNEYTIVISDAEAKVKYLIDPNGHYYTPHTKGMD
ncbi:hypothetical protein [Paenibacillus sp. 23TSA30-6]|uniref:hypothetical protein n=1 Tax=Paenibacillus sp. 23TSA30-6 TaxID=2546104 RepID=UPI001EE1AD86|nr:hypothetical protein [Paenibacillus sp. 23TSA30-6]